MGQAVQAVPQTVLVMGVSGSGKTTVGALLAGRLGWRFIDADDHHPSVNVEKMRRGEALNDADRAPWLQALNTLLRAAETRNERVVLACSALKERYREALLDGLKAARVVHLHGTPELLQARLTARHHAYMPPTLLQSQLATLELSNDALTINVGEPIDRTVPAIMQALELVPMSAIPVP